MTEIYLRVAALVAVLSCAGCAVAPNYLRPEIQHESHVLQHMAPDCPEHGRDIVALTAIWAHEPFSLEVSEGYNFHGGEGVFKDSIAGREVFEARLGYSFRVKP